MAVHRPIAQWLRASRARHAGARAERLAARYLERKGLELVRRNYRTRQGEIDLIMRDADVLVFVEVRFRSRSDFGTPEETVDRRKRARLRAAAAHYLASASGASVPCRFDVMSVTRPNYRLECRWIKDAFAS